MFSSLNSFQSSNNYQKCAPKLIAYYPYNTGLTQKEYFNYTITTNNTVAIAISTKFPSGGYCANLYNSTANARFTVANASIKNKYTICFFLNLNNFTTQADSSRGCITIYELNNTANNISLGANFDHTEAQLSSQTIQTYTVYIKTNNTVLTISSPVINCGTWCHYAITIDGSTLNIYINGVNYSFTGTSNFNLITTSNNLIVATSGGSGNVATFPGFVCDLRVYNRILEINEIQKIYNNTTANNIYI